MTISGADVARAAHAAGFPDSQLVTAVAIAWAESSFDETASHRNSNGSVDYGLWQINTVHGYPELQSGAWRDPAVNAQLAYRVYTAQGWNAWSTHKPTDPVGYTRYQTAIPAAVAYVTQAFGPGVAAAGAAGSAGGLVDSATGSAGDVISSAADIAKEPLAVLHWLEQPGTWQRIAKVGIGTALVVGGVYLLTRVQILEPAGEKVASVVVGGKVGAVRKVAQTAPTST